MSTVHGSEGQRKEEAKNGHFYHGGNGFAGHEDIQSEALTAALYYYDHGFFVVPCCTMTEQGACTFPHTHDTEKSIGKRPILGNEWQNARLTREEIIAWWTTHPTANVGVLLEPSGLLVIDLDSDAATEEATINGLPPGPQVRAGRGVHHYCRNPKNIIGVTVKRGESRGIDVLSKGHVVGFGSIHRSGKPYALLTNWEEWPLEDPPLWAEHLLLDSRTTQAEAEACPDDLPPIDLAALDLAPWLRAVIVQGQSPFSDRYPSRSEAVFAVACALVDAGHETATIASILLDPRFAISEKPRQQGPRWVMGEIARARAKTASSEGIGDDPEDFADDGRDTEGAAAASSTTGGTALPCIIVNNEHLRDVVDHALNAVQKRNDPPSLFVRGGLITRVQHDEQGQRVIVPLTEAALKERLSRDANFYRRTQRKKAWSETKVSPPRDVVESLLVLPALPFPALLGLCACPVLRPDGTILDQPGYDTITKLLYEPAPGLTLPPMPTTPTQADAQAARQFLCTELLGDFPFCEDADTANMLALLLTPIVRPAITGGVPLCLLDKPSPGSGATLLADAVATIATGEHAAKQMMPTGKQSEEEMRKKITSLLMGAQSVIVFDNIEWALASNALQIVLTTPFWGDRPLGGNKDVRLPVRVTWIATANNIQIRGDLARRSYRVRIDAKQDRPWTRNTFRHANLLAWARKNRGELLACLLTMARAWFANGKPPPHTQSPTIGGFEEWTAMVSGILSFAGVHDVLTNLEELYAQVDQDAEQWSIFIQTWHEQLRDKALTVADLATSLHDVDALKEALPDSLEWDTEKLTSSKQRLGYALKKRKDRFFGEYRLEQDAQDAHSRKVRWRVRHLAPTL